MHPNPALVHPLTEPMGSPYVIQELGSVYHRDGCAITSLLTTCGPEAVPDRPPTPPKITLPPFLLSPPSAPLMATTEADLGTCDADYTYASVAFGSGQG